MRWLQPHRQQHLRSLLHLGRSIPANPPPLQGAPLSERTFELPPLFIFHHANAYEEGGRLVVDSIHVRRVGRAGSGWWAGMVVWWHAAAGSVG